MTVLVIGASGFIGHAVTAAQGLHHREIHEAVCALNIKVQSLVASVKLSITGNIDAHTSGLMHSPA